MNATASTYVVYKTVKQIYMYDNSVSMCTKTERQNENTKFKWCKNSFPRVSLHCEQQHRHLMPVASEIFNCSLLSFHFTSASLHVWRKLVMMQLHVTAPSWHNDTELNAEGSVRFSWQTDKMRHWKHSKYYGATSHFRHHCLQAKENNTKQTGDTEHAR